LLYFGPKGQRLPMTIATVDLRVVGKGWERHKKLYVFGYEE
jgi:hypothetical protein